MAPDRRRSDVPDTAHGTLEPGPLIRIANGGLAVDIAPQAGGRMAQITRDGIEWLVGYDEGNRGSDCLGQLSDGALGRAHSSWPV